MAFTIPTREPTEHRAGVSLIFDRDFPEFPADEWTLVYYLRHQQVAPVDITATNDGTTFKINEATTTTETWEIATYDMIGIVSKDSDKHEVYNGKLKITVDPVLFPNYDPRTFWQRRLEAIETAMLNYTPGEPISYSINGRSFTFSSQEEMQSSHAYAKSRLLAENIVETGGNRKILTRFRRPR